MAGLKDFNKEVEALRGLIKAKTTPLPGGRKAQQERVKQGESSLEFFARTYFPHYLTCEPSKLHKYFYQQLPRLIFKAKETGEGDREADAAPRGNAKSTTVSLIFVLWCIAYKYRRFPLIVSETADQAGDFVSCIKVEIESNERLKQDFPELCGEGPIWRSHEIVTNNGAKVRGVGAGKKMRGMRHGAMRPDLVIGDDLENDEQVVSPEQRTKLDKWFFRALMKIGQPDTVYIVVGTILHYDSLLQNLLKKPGWKGRKFKAVINWSQSKLWEKWEQLFSDPVPEKEEAERQADEFFESNREEMLSGTEVLWPEREPYYYLMKMRVSEGPAHFDSEKQNEPINPDDCLFREEWIQYWEDGDVDLSGLPLLGTADPSLGKKSKKADPSAILSGRYKPPVLYLEIADIEKRVPDKIIEDVLAYHKLESFQVFGVEAVQFQQFFAGTLAKIAHERNITLNVKEIPQSGDKTLRIQRLQPWIKNGWIRFKRNHLTLLSQLTKFPMADHDDGPDALEMLVAMAEEYARFAKIEFKSTGERRVESTMENF